MVELHTLATVQGWSMKPSGKWLWSDWPLRSLLKGTDINSFILTGWRGICSGHVIRRTWSELEDCWQVSNSIPSLGEGETQRGNSEVTQELRGRSKIGIWRSWVQVQCSFCPATGGDTIKLHLTTNCALSGTWRQALGLLGGAQTANRRQRTEPVLPLGPFKEIIFFPSLPSFFN